MKIDIDRYGRIRLAHFPDFPVVVYHHPIMIFEEHFDIWTAENHLSKHSESCGCRPEEFDH